MPPLRASTLARLPAPLGRTLMALGLGRSPRDRDWAACRSPTQAIRMAHLFREGGSGMDYVKALPTDLVTTDLLETFLRRDMGGRVIPLLRRLSSNALVEWLPRVAEGGVSWMSQSDRDMVVAQGLLTLGSRLEIGRVPAARAYLNAAIARATVGVRWEPASVALLSYVPNLTTDEVTRAAEAHRRTGQHWDMGMVKLVVGHPACSDELAARVFSECDNMAARIVALECRPDMAHDPEIQRQVVMVYTNETDLLLLVIHTLPVSVLPEVWQRIMDRGEPRFAIRVIQRLSPEGLSAIRMSEADAARLLLESPLESRPAVIAAMSGVVRGEVVADRTDVRPPLPRVSP